MQYEVRRSSPLLIFCSSRGAPQYRKSSSRGSPIGYLQSAFFRCMVAARAPDTGDGGGTKSGSTRSKIGLAYLAGDRLVFARLLAFQSLVARTSRCRFSSLHSGHWSGSVPSTPHIRHLRRMIKTPCRHSFDLSGASAHAGCVHPFLPLLMLMFMRCDLPMTALRVVSSLNSFDSLLAISEHDIRNPASSLRRSTLLGGQLTSCTPHRRRPR